jgi:hypothetical protein
MKTIIENEDGTLIIGNKLYRPVKDTINDDAFGANTKEGMLLSLMKGLESKQDRKNYPNSVFWMKDGTYMVEYDEKEKYFWCSYLQVWSVFEKEFGMEFYEIQSFCRGLMEQHFKRRGLKANYAPVKFSMHIERHFKGH